MTTSASMASAIGVARMPTQGSWRPKVSTVVGSPARLIDALGVRIELVGLIAIETRRSWPLEMPPKVPPDEFFLNPSGVSSSRCSLPRWRTHSKPSPKAAA